MPSRFLLAYIIVLLYRKKNNVYFPRRGCPHNYGTPQRWRAFGYTCVRDQPATQTKFNRAQNSVSPKLFTNPPTRPSMENMFTFNQSVHESIQPPIYSPSKDYAGCGYCCRTAPILTSQAREGGGVGAGRERQRESGGGNHFWAIPTLVYASASTRLKERTRPE